MYNEFMKLGRKRKYVYDIDKIEKLQSKGMTLTQVSIVVEIPRKILYTFLHRNYECFETKNVRYELRPGFVDKSRYDIEKIINLENNGCTRASLARMYTVSRSAFGKYLKKYYERFETKNVRYELRTGKKGVNNNDTSD